MSAHLGESGWGPDRAARKTLQAPAEKAGKRRLRRRDLLPIRPAEPPLPAREFVPLRPEVQRGFDEDCRQDSPRCGIALPGAGRRARAAGRAGGARQRRAKHAEHSHGLTRRALPGRRHRHQSGSPPRSRSACRARCRCRWCGRSRPRRGTGRGRCRCPASGASSGAGRAGGPAGPHRPSPPVRRG